MAMIGFIFVFLMLCCATVALVFATWGILMLTGRLKFMEVFVVLCVSTALGFAWHELLSNVTITVGGI